LVGSIYISLWPVYGQTSPFFLFHHHHQFERSFLPIEPFPGKDNPFYYNRAKPVKIFFRFSPPSAFSSPVKGLFAQEDPSRGAIGRKRRKPDDALGRILRRTRAFRAAKGRVGDH
jgi:hypothetical protein